jgi:hypothetical protein
LVPAGEGREPGKVVDEPRRLVQQKDEAVLDGRRLGLQAGDLVDRQRPELTRGLV